MALSNLFGQPISYGPSNQYNMTGFFDTFDGLPEFVPFVVTPVLPGARTGNACPAWYWNGSSGRQLLPPEAQENKPARSNTGVYSSALTSDSGFESTRRAS